MKNFLIIDKKERKTIDFSEKCIYANTYIEVDDVKYYKKIITEENQMHEFEKILNVSLFGENDRFVLVENMGGLLTGDVIRLMIPTGMCRNERKVDFVFNPKDFYFRKGKMFIDCIEKK